MTREEKIEKLAGDPDIMEKASAIREPADMIAFAEEKGIDITEEEAAEAISLLSDEEGELSLDSLSSVAGGKKC